MNIDEKKDRKMAMQFMPSNLPSGSDKMPLLWE